jgi:hypothetical protein
MYYVISICTSKYCFGLIKHREVVFDLCKCNQTIEPKIFRKGEWMDFLCQIYEKYKNREQQYQKDQCALKMDNFSPINDKGLWGNLRKMK